MISPVTVRFDVVMADKIVIFGSLFSDYLTMLPMVTSTPTMIANASVPDMARARFTISALVVCGCMVYCISLSTDSKEI